MKFNELPLDMQSDVKELAVRHSLTIEDTVQYYLMGGSEFGDILCSLKDKGYPDEIIRLCNNNYWAEQNKKPWEELSNLNKREKFSDVCNNLLDQIAKSLRIYKLLDWLSEKLK